MDAAGGFDFHLFSHVFFKEFHIGQHSAGAAKAGGCFDIVRSPFSDTAAGGDFFFFRKIAGLHDDLQDMVPYGLLHSFDFTGHVGKIALLQGTDVDDHVDFISAIPDGLCRLKGLGRRAAVSQRKAHHCADGEGREMLMDFLHKRGGDAHRNHVVPFRLFT